MLHHAGSSEDAEHMPTAVTVCATIATNEIPTIVAEMFGGHDATSCTEWSWWTRQVVSKVSRQCAASREYNKKTFAKRRWEAERVDIAAAHQCAK